MAYLNEIYNDGALVRPYGGFAPKPPPSFGGNGEGWGGGCALMGDFPPTIDFCGLAEHKQQHKAADEHNHAFHQSYPTAFIVVAISALNSLMLLGRVKAILSDISQDMICSRNNKSHTEHIKEQPCVIQTIHRILPILNKANGLFKRNFKLRLSRT